MRTGILSSVITWVTGRRRLQSLWERIHSVSLTGMNIGGGSDIETSGELRVLRQVCGSVTGGDAPVVFDVGANVGRYALKAISAFHEDLSLYCFEPSESAFNKLRINLRGFPNVRLHNFGFGDAEGDSVLYMDTPASGLSSVYRRKLEHLDIRMDRTERIRLRRMDDFCRENGIDTVHFLKLDVEGHELKVLEGAKNLIDSNAIGFIQFEFGGCNIDSRTYFKDFFLLLDPKFKLYRVLKDGIIPVLKYKEILEIFTTTNYLAISRKSFP